MRARWIAWVAALGAIAACDAEQVATDASATGSGAAGSGASGGGATGGTGGDGSGAGAAGGGGSGGNIPQECLDMADAATLFLASLEQDELLLAAADFGSDEHRKFEFLPPLSAPRDGVSMKDLDRDERGYLAELLQAAFSAPGYLKLESVRALESVLAMQESGVPSTPNRDPENYFIQVYGTPSIDSELPWGFRFEGHHLSLQAGVIACTVYSATPAFWGASPETTPLQDEIDAAEALWTSLDGTQQAKAQATVNADAIGVKIGKLDPLQAEGLRGVEMTAAQLLLLQEIIGGYLGNMAAPIATARLAAIEAEGYDDVSFAYDGGDFRVLGPTFVIELVYEGGTHIHSVWRDYDGDYGDDLIAQHMALQ